MNCSWCLSLRCEIAASVAVLPCRRRGQHGGRRCDAGPRAFFLSLFRRGGCAPRGMNEQYFEHVLLFAGDSGVFVLDIELLDDPYTDGELSEADTDDGLPAVREDDTARGSVADWPPLEDGPPHRL